MDIMVAVVAVLTSSSDSFRCNNPDLQSNRNELSTYPVRRARKQNISSALNTFETSLLQVQ